MRLDEEKLEALRAWGQGLRQAEGEELAATGRAILMLVEEIDRLHVELWHARLRMQEADPEPTQERPAEEEEPVGSALQGRLRRVLRRDPPRPAEAAPAETPPDDGSAQSWIESLRRQT